MQSKIEDQIFHLDLKQIAKTLQIAGWVSFWLQVGLTVAAGLMIIFAITGRNFSQAVTRVPRVGVINAGRATTPGIGVGIFWAICGILVLLFSLYLAFRLTRFAKRLRHPDRIMHPRKSEVLKQLRLGVIVGLVGALLTILGGGATLSVLLAKSIAQPQGVAIYDPTRIIRSLDIFVAMANMNGITAHFVGLTMSLGLLNWLRRVETIDHKGELKSE